MNLVLEQNYGNVDLNKIKRRMIISKLLNEILIIMLLILVPVSCVNKNKQNETHLIAVTYRGYEDKTYYLIKGDTVSSICFSTFKYSNGTYDIIGDGIDSIYCKRKIPELKNKSFNHRKGHVSDELISELSTFLSLAKDELNFDSIRGITFRGADVFDVTVALSNDFACHKCDNVYKRIKEFMDKIPLKDKMNVVLKPYNIEVSSIILDYDSKVLKRNTKEHHMNSADYGYSGAVPQEYSYVFWLRAIIESRLMAE